MQAYRFTSGLVSIPIRCRKASHRKYSQESAEEQGLAGSFDLSQRTSPLEALNNQLDACETATCGRIDRADEVNPLALANRTRKSAPGCKRMKPIQIFEAASGKDKITLVPVGTGCALNCNSQAPPGRLFSNGAVSPRADSSELAF